MSDTPDDHRGVEPGQELIPASALAHAEVLDLAESSEPFRTVPAHLRPRSALPGQELLRMLGPDLVCRIVQELEDIYSQGANTHVDLRLHFHEGIPRRADFVPVQAFKLGRPPGDPHRR